MRWLAAGSSLGLALGLFVGCHRPPPPAPVVVDAGPPIVDAGPPVPTRLELGLSAQLVDGGTTEVVLSGTRVLVPVSDHLRVTGNLPLQNYRIRLFDEADRALASNDEAAASDGGLDYQIALTAPLEPGHRYALVVEPEDGASLIDGLGRPQPEVRQELLVEGERQKPPPPQRPGHHTKHRPHRRGH